MKPYILISFIAILSTSCVKNIDLKLKNGEPSYVIEGNFSDDTIGNQIKITKSIDYKSSNTFPSVTNANVTIKDEAGNIETLTHSQDGVYKIVTTTPQYGKAFTLNVNVDGKTFTSTSVMPFPTKLDSINFLKFSFGANDNINIVPIYKDSFGVKNFYRFIVAQNQKVSSDIFVSDDIFSDGIVSGQPYFGDYELESGDTAHVEMQCINKDVYLYFFSFDQNLGGNATPANPETNIKGGALGYFNVFTKSRYSKKVP